MRSPVLPLALLLPFSMPAADEKPVPVQADPMHKTVFENEYIRVIDVQIPPGKTTLYHTHVTPSVIVYLTQSTNRSESWPDKEILLREISPGQSRFAPYDEKPLSHRVTNTGVGLFRVFDIEFLKKPSGQPPLEKIESPHIETHWDEKLVRSSSLTLEPSAEVEIPAHDYASLIVAISGTLHLRPDGTAPSKSPLRWGDYQFHPARTKFAVRNTGKDKAEAVLLELK
jgi:hypothetical protein